MGPEAAGGVAPGGGVVVVVEVVGEAGAGTAVLLRLSLMWALRVLPSDS